MVVAGPADGAAGRMKHDGVVGVVLDRLAGMFDHDQLHVIRRSVKRSRGRRFVQDDDACLRRANSNAGPQIGCPFSAGDKSKRGLRSRIFENSARHGVMRFVTQ